MMWWCFLVQIVLTLAVQDGGGVAIDSGITKFWTDDYKVFDQIYGRTSDKELYGPAGKAIDVAKFLKTDALNVKSYQPNDATAAGSQIDAFGDNLDYIGQRIKYGIDIKPSKTANKIMFNVYKPVTEYSDPETFDYLKHLEQLGKQQTVDFPKQTVRGFYPYPGLRAMTAMSAGADNFKSIQDILDAQENKEKKHKEKLVDDGEVKYINYAGASGNKIKKQNLRYMQSNNINSVNRCGGKNQGRCRKRSNTHGRYRYNTGLPALRKIKHTIVSE